MRGKVLSSCMGERSHKSPRLLSINFVIICAAIHECVYPQRPLGFERGADGTF